MYVGVLTLDLLLGDIASLKQKRSAIRPLVAELRRRYPGASVAETGYLGRHRRAELGIAGVSSAAALDSAKGVIRTEVGRQTGLRHTPSVTFVADTVPDNARHIEELLERAKVADARVARNREGAHPAGDPDPYRPGPDGDGGY